jgi:hypothetical protein
VRWAAEAGGPGGGSHPVDYEEAPR